MILKNHRFRRFMDEFSGLSLTRYRNIDNHHLSYFELEGMGFKEIIRKSIDHDEELKIILKLESKNGNIPKTELTIDLIEGRFIGLNRTFNEEQNLRVYQMNKPFNYH